MSERYFPRMTPKVRGLLHRAEACELDSQTTRGADKSIAMLLIWDRWLKLTDDLKSDLRLTKAGREWIQNDRLRQVERGL